MLPPQSQPEGIFQWLSLQPEVGRKMIAVFWGFCGPDLRVTHSQYRRKEREGKKKFKRGKEKLFEQ